MPIFYLDTSAIAQRYEKKAGTDAINFIFDNSSTAEITTSFLTVLELTSIVSDLGKSQLSKPEADKIEGGIGRDFAGNVSVLPLEQPFINGSLRLIRIYGLKPIRALHLSSALGLQQIASDSTIVFICSDKPLSNAARSEKLPVIDPTEPKAMETLRSFFRT